MNASLRPLLAEFLGTALFVFLAAGGVVAGEMTAGSVTPLAIALAQGAGFAVLVSVFLEVSGGHLNPATSVGVWAAGRIDGGTCARYLLAQLAGGVAGAGLLSALLPSVAVRAASAGTPQLSLNIGFLQGVGIEAVFTFVLVSAVLGTTIAGDAPRIGGLAVGLAIFGAAVVAGGLTGAALNPARAFGPAVVSWTWHSQAVYWIGPLVGGLAAGGAWRALFFERDAETAA